MLQQLTHSDHDQVIVEAQLGRPVRGRWAVAHRCHLGVPTVIESYPRLEDGSPFPTIFWLTCPLLAKRASRLEAEGYMRALTGRLGRDISLRERLGRSLDRYRRRRDAREPLGDIPAPGGGPDRVKCLHAHLAHQLADPPNPVGAVTVAETGWPDCVQPCVASPR